MTSCFDGIEFDGVSFAYNGAPIIQDASFRLHSGSSYCVIGPNGGGKTTLVKLMLGLLSPQKGHINAFGKNPSGNRNGVAYVPQIQQVNPLIPITVEQVLKMASRKCWALMNSGPRVEDLIERFRLGDLRNTSFHILSSGQKQRTLVARALIGNPRLLILDEPLAHADPRVEKAFKDELLRIQHECMLLVVTHDISFVYAMFHEVLCVNRTVRTHHTHELNAALLRELYGGQLRWVDHDHDTCNVSHADKTDGPDEEHSTRIL